jgi:hypothetical protein
VVIVVWKESGWLYCIRCIRLELAIQALVGLGVRGSEHWVQRRRPLVYADEAWYHLAKPRQVRVTMNIEHCHMRRQLVYCMQMKLCHRCSCGSHTAFDWIWLEWPLRSNYRHHEHSARG